MNETLNILKSRRACRSFSDKPVEEEKLNAILEAGTYAPTGMGKQSPIIIAVTNKELRDRLSKLNAAVMNSDGDPFYGAPTVLVVLADRTVPTYLYDGSLVMGNLMNAAESLGVNSIWIHRAREVFAGDEGKKILKDLGITGDYEGIGNCCLGYMQAPLQSPKPRKENYIYRVK